MKVQQSIEAAILERQVIARQPPFARLITSGRDQSEATPDQVRPSRTPSALLASLVLSQWQRDHHPRSLPRHAYDFDSTIERRRSLSHPCQAEPAGIDGDPDLEVVIQTAFSGEPSAASW